MGGPLQNLPIGSTYGLWTVLEEKGRNKHGQKLFKCMCSCGFVTEITGGSLVTGKSTSCRSCAMATKKHHYTRGDQLRFLYIIEVGEYFKIGVTNTPQKRVAALEVSNPYPCNVVLLCWNRTGLEKDLHGLYPDKHHKYEWFCGLTEEVLRNLTTVIGKDNLLYEEDYANPDR